MKRTLDFNDLDPEEMAMTEKLEFKEVKDEQCRIYYFVGACLEISKVRRVCVRSSGSHRLETEDGEKFIIAPSWYAIEIVADEWSF